MLCDLQADVESQAVQHEREREALKAEVQRHKQAVTKAMHEKEEAALKFTQGMQRLKHAHELDQASQVAAPDAPDCMIVLLPKPRMTKNSTENRWQLPA